MTRGNFPIFIFRLLILPSCPWTNFVLQEKRLIFAALCTFGVEYLVPIETDGLTESEHPKLAEMHPRKTLLLKRDLVQTVVHTVMQATSCAQ